VRSRPYTGQNSPVCNRTALGHSRRGAIPVFS
jgi:hypothetical protein